MVMLECACDWLISAHYFDKACDLFGFAVETYAKHLTFD